MEKREWIYYGVSVAVVLFWLFVFYRTRDGGQTSQAMDVSSLFKRDAMTGSPLEGQFAPQFAPPLPYSDSDPFAGCIGSSCDMSTLPYDMMSQEMTQLPYPQYTPDPVVPLIPEQQQAPLAVL